MPSSIPGISQLISRCILRQYSRSLHYGLTKSCKPMHLLGLMVLLLVSWKPLLAQLVPVNGPIALPATNVTSSSAPQNILLKTTSAITISSFTVPVSQGNKQEYTVGTVSGCAVDGVTSNPVGTVLHGSHYVQPRLPWPASCAPAGGHQRRQDQYWFEWYGLRSPCSDHALAPS